MDRFESDSKGGDAGKLTDAYKTLMTYAEAAPSAAGDEAVGETGYRFDRGAVEGAIVVTVRRQAPSDARAET